MPLFEPPPPPPEPPEPEPEFRLPEWAAPSPNVLGMPVGERVILVQRPDLAIAVVGMVAFPTGLRLTTLFKARGPADG